MTRSLAFLSLMLTLAGCGVAETGAVAVTQATAKAEEARQGQRTEARVRQQVEAAVQQDKDQRQAAETASQ